MDPARAGCAGRGDAHAVNPAGAGGDAAGAVRANPGTGALSTQARSFFAAVRTQLVHVRVHPLTLEVIAMPSPDPLEPVPGPTYVLPQRALVSGWLLSALAVVLAIALLAGDSQLDALQKMAGYTGKQSAFKDIQGYLEGLRDSLIPLAIPLGAIGLAGGGAAYMVGNQMAQRILGGLVIGIALALMGPAIVA